MTLKKQCKMVIRPAGAGAANRRCMKDAKPGVDYCSVHQLPARAPRVEDPATKAALAIELARSALAQLEERHYEALYRTEEGQRFLRGLRALEEREEEPSETSASCEKCGAEFEVDDEAPNYEGVGVMLMHQGAHVGYKLDGGNGYEFVCESCGSEMEL